MVDLRAPPTRPKRKKIWVDYLVEFRWIVVVFVALPISATLYFITYVNELRAESKRHKQRQREHEENVCKVVKRLKQRNPKKDGLVCTTRKPYIVVGSRNVDYKRARHFEVDLSEFGNILESISQSLGFIAPTTGQSIGNRVLSQGVGLDTCADVTGSRPTPCELWGLRVCTGAARDPSLTGGLYGLCQKKKKRMIARVEPLVTMGQLSRITVPMNLALAVVSELDDLTIGGLVNGYGIEGSSHIYGLFADTLISLEVVLADGRVVWATKDNEYSDLFYAIPWSQGALGLLVSAEIKLIPIKEYMKLTYKPVRGNLRELAQAYADTFAPRDGDPDKVPDFVESLIYTPTEGVFMTGMYASKQEAMRKGNVINSIGWWFKPWFYQHAQKALKRGEFVEYIPTREYYHRHTRSYFWELKLILPFGDQWWFRWLMGWSLPPKISLLKITQGEAIRKYYHDMHVIQDMLLPLHKVADALEFLHEEMEVYPIWLCPHRLFKLPMKTMVYPEPGFENNLRQGDTSYAQMFTDIGVYYAPGPVLRGEVFDGAEAVHHLENWLIRNHGFQPQYSVSELSEKNFWRMFNAELYEKCRVKYGAIGIFMDVYYKCKKGKKTEKEVLEAEAAIAEEAYAEAH